MTETTRRRPVRVVGAGISGLSAAVALQDQGFTVEIRAAEPPALTTSSVAAAIWHPFFQPSDPVYLARALTSYDVLLEHAADPTSGVSVRTLREFFRGPTTPPWWMEALRDRQAITAVTPGDGYTGAWSVRVPVADTSRYLGFLLERFRAGGGTFTSARVTSLAAELEDAAVVVNGTGYGSLALTGERDVDLVRGVVLRCEKPVGLDGCWIDDTDPARPTYVIEREDDVILGGTADPALVSTAVDDRTVADVLTRCAALVPATAGARVLDVRIGFRPARATVRLERDPGQPRIVHDYGHGGAGFTLAWGCAAEVVDLVRAALPVTIRS